MRAVNPVDLIWSTLVLKVVFANNNEFLSFLKVQIIVVSKKFQASSVKNNEAGDGSSDNHLQPPRWKECSRDCAS